MRTQQNITLHNYTTSSSQKSTLYNINLYANNNWLTPYITNQNISIVNTTTIIILKQKTDTWIPVNLPLSWQGDSALEQII